MTARGGAQYSPVADDLQAPPPPRAGAYLLTSHALTKFGSKAWEFSIPLLLLQFTSGSLLAPALWGLLTMLAKLALNPLLGSWSDHVDSRLRVVSLGCTVQAATALLAVLLLAVLELGASGFQVGFLFVCMTACGVVEGLAASLASVSVKRDWVPTVFEEHAPDQVLTSMNTSMSNIDLTAEMLGPVLAGLVLAAAPTPLAGFAVIGSANALSFVPEYFLLRRLFHACARLREPRTQSQKQQEAAAAPRRNSNLLSTWRVWVTHPGGVPLVTTSMALVYFTALSPHGIVLTAYLATNGVNPVALSVFRGAGALSGIAGISLFGRIVHCLRLRGASFAHVAGQAVVVVLAALALETSSSDDDASVLGVPFDLLWFMVFVVLSRVGLYGFDVGVLELQQRQVDSDCRNAVGAIESSLQSAATMAMYGLSMHVSSPGDFAHIAWLSALAVVASAALFGMYLLLFHEHEHGHLQGQVCHAHTTQQQRSLEESRSLIHSHIHYVGFTGLMPGHRASEAEDHGHDHDHSHGHSYQHPDEAAEKGAVELGPA